MQKNIVMNTAIKEGINVAQAWKIIFYALGHMCILIILWMSMMAIHKDYFCMFVLILVLGGFASYYLIKKTESLAHLWSGAYLYKHKPHFFLANSPALIALKMTSTGVLTANWNFLQSRNKRMSQLSSSPRELHLIKLT